MVGAGGKEGLRGLGQPGPGASQFGERRGVKTDSALLCLPSSL